MLLKNSSSAAFSGNSSPAFSTVFQRSHDVPGNHLPNEAGSLIASMMLGCRVMRPGRAGALGGTVGREGDCFAVG